MAASQTREFKHTYQIRKRRKRDYRYLVFEKVLARVNRRHHQAFLSNILDNYRSN